MKQSELKSKSKIALKKVEISIDKMIDLQDLGFGGEVTARILEMLNTLQSRYIRWSQ